MNELLNRIVSFVTGGGGAGTLELCSRRPVPGLPEQSLRKLAQSVASDPDGQLHECVDSQGASM